MVEGPLEARFSLDKSRFEQTGLNILQGKMKLGVFLVVG